MADVEGLRMVGAPDRPVPWPLFLSEAIGTALLVLVGLSLVILMFGAGSPIAPVVPNEALRRLITGFLFGTTGALIALSPIGRESGAHINPVVTLGFCLMGRLDATTAAGLRRCAACGRGGRRAASPCLGLDGTERGVRRDPAGPGYPTGTVAHGRGDHDLCHGHAAVRVPRVSAPPPIHAGDLPAALRRDGVARGADLRHQHQSRPQPSARRSYPGSGTAGGSTGWGRSSACSPRFSSCNALAGRIEVAKLYYFDSDRHGILRRKPRQTRSTHMTAESQPSGGEPHQPRVAEVGPVPLRTPVGHRARGLQRVGRRVELLPARPRPVAGLPLGRRRAGRHLRRPAAALLRAGALEREGPDHQGAALRPDEQRGEPRRGRQGVLLLPRLHADPLVHEVSVQVSAGRRTRTTTWSQTNGRRSRGEPEYELLDTGVFDDDRYFDVFVEYAKASPDDLLVEITICNRGPEAAALHVLPTVWFRNTWSWGGARSRARRWRRRRTKARSASIARRASRSRRAVLLLRRRAETCSSPRTKRTPSGSSARRTGRRT